MENTSADDRIRDVLDNYRCALDALRTLAETQLKHAKENQERDVAELVGRMRQAIERLSAGEQSSNPYDIGHAWNTFRDCKIGLDSLMSFPQDAMLAETIFTSIFSRFEAYLGALLRTLYSIKPEILKAAGLKPIEFADVLDRTKEEIIESTIDRDIDSLLRMSYSRCFGKLANRFGAGTLTEFDNWKRFIECSQRRNVITHCGGIASRQYIDVCKSKGVKPEDGMCIGKKLGVAPAYLFESIDIVAETGLKLGQVLWRTLNDDSVDAADAHLGDMMFEILRDERWKLALRMGEFGNDCSKRRYNRPRQERSVKILLINYAQAAKWDGDNERAMKIIDGVDFSGSGPEYRLAVACLKDDWKGAAGFMRQVGANSELLPGHSYVYWPIFRRFRETPEFSAMFKEVFGVEFADEAKKEQGQQNLPAPPTEPEEE